MLIEQTRVDGREYWVLRDDKGIAAMAETRDAVLPRQLRAPDREADRPRDEAAGEDRRPD